MNRNLSQEHPSASEQAKQIEKWHNDPANWKMGFLYFNKEDQRIFVDKRLIKWAGITINFAHPKSYWFFIGMICFFGFIIFMITKNSPY